MATDLEDRAALVTGGGSGFGRAVAHELAGRGAAVLVADLDLASARRVARSIEEAGGRAAAHWVDVTDVRSVCDMVTAAARLGPLRIAVNNAGVAGVGVPVADYPVAAWNQLMRVNLDGVFLSMKAEIPVMREAGSGSVVNMASVLGTVGRANASAYVAAKHGVIGLTKSAALEYAADGIRINAVAPGFVLTPLNESRLSVEDREQLVKEHALGRLGEVAEVAAVVGFLAGDASSYVTGSCYLVDGGFAVR